MILHYAVSFSKKWAFLLYKMFVQEFVLIVYAQGFLIYFVIASDDSDEAVSDSVGEEE